MNGLMLKIKQRCLMLLSTEVALFLFLLLAVQGSALAVVYSTYENRRLFSTLEALRDGAEEMQVSWRQLLLEQSTLASFNQVVHVAQDQLSMTVPDPEQVIILQHEGRY